MPSINRPDRVTGIPIHPNYVVKHYPKHGDSVVLGQIAKVLSKYDTSERPEAFLRKLRAQKGDATFTTRHGTVVRVVLSTVGVDSRTTDAQTLRAVERVLAAALRAVTMDAPKKRDPIGIIGAPKSRCSAWARSKAPAAARDVDKLLNATEKEVARAGGTKTLSYRTDIGGLSPIPAVVKVTCKDPKGKKNPSDFYFNVTVY